MKKPLIFPAVPSSKRMNITCEHALSRCLTYEKNKYFNTLDIKCLAGVSLISGARLMLLDMFLQSQASHLLFVDDDMLAMSDDCIKLLLDAKKPVINGMSCSRHIDTSLVHRPLLSDEEEEKRVFGDDPFEVETSGLAFTLIERLPLEHLKGYCGSSEMPFQPIMYRGLYEGEDGSFCRRMAKIGYTIWYHPKAVIGHIGEYPYTVNDWRNKIHSPRYKYYKEQGRI